MYAAEPATSSFPDGALAKQEKCRPYKERRIGNTPVPRCLFRSIYFAAEELLFAFVNFASCGSGDHYLFLIVLLAKAENLNHFPVCLKPAGLRARNAAAFSFYAVAQLQQVFQPSPFSTLELS